MADPVLAPVVPAVLAWARRTASVTAEEAAKAAGVRPERLLGWEAGEGQPTLPMLRKLAEKYKRPLSVMLLRRPPRDFQPLRDFRRTADGPVGTMPARVAYEIRFAQERRETALELAADAGVEPPPFTASASIEEEPDRVGERVRRLLGIDMPTQLRAAQKDKVFELWRGAVENLGVLVFAMSGSHAPPVREVRGFAIPADVFPVVAVNSRDRSNGRTFTLLHEFTHLLLGQGVVESAIAQVRGLPAPVRRVERFCNAVAAAALIPASAAQEEARRLGKDEASEWQDSELVAVASKLGVSREALLLRMVHCRFASGRAYVHKRRSFEAEYAALDEPAAEKKEVRIPPANLVLGRYGRQFTRLVLDGYRERHLTMSAAAGLLGVQAKHVARVEQLAQGAP